MRTRQLGIALTMGALALTGCSEETTGPEPTATAAMTVDASTEFAYVALGDPAESVTVADAGASAAWDLGFQATTVALNGGTGAAGEVVGYCVCQNAGATDAEVIAMDGGAELGAFEAVTAADIPSSESAWEAEVFEAADADRKWYRYNLEGTHLIYPTFNVYLVRAGEAVYKVQLVNYYGPAGETRQITFRYARLGE